MMKILFRLESTSSFLISILVNGPPHRVFLRGDEGVNAMDWKNKRNEHKTSRTSSVHQFRSESGVTIFVWMIEAIQYATKPNPARKPQSTILFRLRTSGMFQATTFSSTTQDHTRTKNHQDGPRQIQPILHDIPQDMNKLCTKHVADPSDGNPHLLLPESIELCLRRGGESVESIRKCSICSGERIVGRSISVKPVDCKRIRLESFANGREGVETIILLLVTRLGLHASWHDRRFSS